MPKALDKKLIIAIVSKLKKIREAKGLTQEDFYNDTGIHIGRIESGKYDITVTTLKRICKYYNLPLSEFFEGI